MNTNFRRFNIFVPWLAALVLFALSAIALMSEIVPFGRNLATASQRFENIEAGVGRQSYSAFGQRYVLNDCMEAIAGPMGLAQPTQRRNIVLRECQGLAQKIVSTTPSFAFAWYIGALASSELREFELFNAQLINAQKMAPNEQWLAEHRVRLAEENLQHLSPEARNGHDSDLKLLVQSRLGVASIASRYVKQADFRERITSIVETMSEEEQARFVSYVRSAARREGAQ